MGRCDTVGLRCVALRGKVVATKPSASASASLAHPRRSCVRLVLVQCSYRLVPSAFRLAMSLLTLSNQVLRVPSALLESAGTVYDEADASASSSAPRPLDAPPDLHDRVFVHPLWMERMGWQCDDTMIVAQRVQGNNKNNGNAGQQQAAESIQLQVG